jgi:outer membrane protein OmpA-like peptidoglycan-associated protein
MKRMTVMTVMLALAASLAVADPALGGGRGLFRVQDARVEEDGALVFSTRWMFHRADLGEDQTQYRGPLFAELSYAPFPFVEVFGGLVGVTDFTTSPNFTYDMQGEMAGVKLSIPWIPVLKVAGSLNWAIENNTHQFEGYLDNMMGYPGKSWRAIGSLRFWELYKTLPTIMFNYGEEFDKDLMYHHFFGTGIEFASDALDLFIEGTSQAGASKDFFTKEAKIRVTPGVRIKIPYFHLTGGLEMGVTDSVPDFEGIAGFNIVSPFPKPPAKPWGRLAGKVEDSRSGLPLDAKITITQPFRRSMKTDPKNGIFYMQKAPTGVVIVEASREGYISEAVPLVIVDKGFANYTFRLKPLVPYGTVAGRITDAYTGKPLEGQVTFVAANIAPITSSGTTGFFRVDNVPAGLVNVKVDKAGYFPEERVAEVEDGGVSKLNIALASLDMKGSYKGKVVDKATGNAVPAQVSFVKGDRSPITPDASGAFAMELPVGNYEVKVEAPGYLPQASAFAMNKGDTVYRAYEMVSKGMVLTLKGVYFEFGKATLKTESYPALMEAAQIMKDNPDIQVELQGHTDNVGSDASNQKLSEKRAYAVMNWLVQFGGIDAKRITAKGFGEMKPIASNDTEEGRQLNRRTDLVILK